MFHICMDLIHRVCCGLELRGFLGFDLRFLFRHRLERLFPSCLSVLLDVGHFGIFGEELCGISRPSFSLVVSLLFGIS